ncbi:hypothetical protein N431DRAFT_456508 [Stipitochalara longipes BDJ]|nr:hypothetical protein N431DRAFT_456508 [Stipitochalara longipes BDJ]
MAFEAEVNTSQRLCRCSEDRSTYAICGHTITTIISTEGCPTDCRKNSFGYCTLLESCPSCSLSDRSVVSRRSEVSGQTVGGGQHEADINGDLLPGVPKGAASQTAKQLIQSQIDNIMNEAVEQQSTNHSINNQGIKKAEEATKELKKFIATLHFTGQIEKIFDTAEKTISRAHKGSWELDANRFLLAIAAAAKRGDKGEVDRSMASSLIERKRLEDAIKENLMDVKKAVLKQCEEGMDRILEALEKTSS